jgi:lipopolysaccharide transport system permease protein
MSEKPDDDTEFDLVIEAGRAERNYWRDIWRSRELLVFLSWRDLLVRYKQTAIGIAWALTQPIVTMVVFTLIFGHYAQLPSGGVPYPILVFAGLLPWQFFANALGEITNSLVGNSNLLSKVYFPRILIPVSTLLVSCVDFLISAAILVVLYVWFGMAPDWRIIALPLFLLLTLMSVFGLGLWLASLNVRYRDFRLVVPFIIQLGVFVSPIGFSSRVIPDAWQPLYSLNPMVQVIEGFRWSLLRGDGNVSLLGLGVSVAVLVVLVATGLRYFRKTERSFADVI